MAKVLLLFIQSNTVDVYVNVLTHCIKEENVRDVFFVGREEPASKEFELIEFVGLIRERITELAESHHEYVPVRDQIPNLPQAKGKIFRIEFSRPHEILIELKKRFPDLETLIVDVTGCDKRLASDVMVSFVAEGIKHVCHFQLANKVFSPEWREAGRSRLYHDLKADVTYYKYDDFSRPGTTISTLNRMRAQGNLIKVLLIISIMLGFVVVILINTQQTTLAQFTAFLLAVVTGLGFLEDTFSLLDRFRK